jgi:hypothetical protein
MLNGESHANREWEMGMTLFVLGLLMTGLMLISWIPDRSLNAYFSTRSVAALTTRDKTTSEQTESSYLLLLPDSQITQKYQEAEVGSASATLAEVVTMLETHYHQAAPTAVPSP